MPFPTSVVAIAGQLFSQNITVYEINRARSQDGEVDNTRLPDRVITGVVQPSTELDIAITDDGSISDKGFLLFHTTYDLFAFDTTNTTESVLQTIVIYEGNDWEVNKREDWRDKTSGFNQYILTKFVDTGTI